MTASHERGSATVESLLVSVLLVAVTLTVLQIAFVAHVRSVAIDSAIAGATHAALADTTDADGVTRTRDLIALGVSDGFVRDVGVERTRSEGLDIVAISVNLDVPAIGPWLPLVTTRVTGRAIDEVQPTD